MIRLRRALHRTSSSALHRTASTVARSSSTPRSPRTLADDLGNKLSFDAWQDAMMRPRRSTSQLSGRSGNGGSPLGKRLTHTQSVPTNWDASAAGSEDVELGSDVEHYRFSGEPGEQQQQLIMMLSVQIACSPRWGCRTAHTAHAERRYS